MLDASGNLRVAQPGCDAIQIGTRAPSSARPCDAPTGQRLVGGEDPGLNVRRYSLASRPTLVGSFGGPGGYLDTTTGIKGRGRRDAKRFTRWAESGRGAAGRRYVRNNP